jgi:hypothetical protein
MEFRKGVYFLRLRSRTGPAPKGRPAMARRPQGEGFHTDLLRPVVSEKTAGWQGRAPFRLCVIPKGEVDLSPANEANRRR